MADLTDTYYASSAFHGYGSQLLVGNGASPEVFTAVAEVLTITPGSMDTADIDRTHLRSPEAHHEHMPGLRDSAPFAIEGNWRPDHESQANGTGSPQTGNGLLFLHRTRAIRNMKIKLSDDAETEWPFLGYVSKFQPGEIGIEDKVNFSAEIMPTQDYSIDLP